MVFVQEQALPPDLEASQTATNSITDHGEDLTSELADVKAALSRSIIAMSSFISLDIPHHGPLLHTLLDWVVSVGREDLLSTALLSLGNVARDSELQLFAVTADG